MPGLKASGLSPDLSKLSESLSGWSVHGLNSAHNGYIKTYLNLGWVGVCLLAMVLIGGYQRAVAAFRRDAEIGSLTLAFIATGAIYSVTEAGFRMLSPTWFFLLLAVVATGGISSGSMRTRPLAPPRQRRRNVAAR